MNEIIGPIYYIFANDPSIEWRQWAEADTFYCFTVIYLISKFVYHKLNQIYLCAANQSLMGLEGVRENFVKELDDSQWG